MEKPKAHVSEFKKLELDIIKKIFDENSVIGILDLSNLPSAQFQKLKHKLKELISIRVSKKSLMKLAIKSCKKDSIRNLEKYLDNCMPAILFSNNDPFKISKQLSKNKSNMAAKSGQISPRDIEIPEGPTSFPAGPVVGELGAAGIKAAIEDGKVVVKQSKVIVRKGEVIDQKAADLLAKFNIEPMEIGLNLVAAYQNGEILEKETLEIDEDKIIQEIGSASGGAFNLAIFSGYPTKDTIELLLKKAESEKIVLSKKIPEEVSAEEKAEESKEVPAEEKAEESKEVPAEEKAEDLSQSENQSDKEEKNDIGDYSKKDAEKAQEIINQMKDSHGG